MKIDIFGKNKLKGIRNIPNKKFLNFNNSLHISSYKYHDVFSISKKYDLIDYSTYYNLDGYYIGKTGQHIDITRYLPDIKVEHISKWIK